MILHNKASKLIYAIKILRYMACSLCNVAVLVQDLGGSCDAEGAA